MLWSSEEQQQQSDNLTLSFSFAKTITFICLFLLFAFYQVQQRTAVKSVANQTSGNLSLNGDIHRKETGKSVTISPNAIG